MLRNSFISSFKPFFSAFTIALLCILAVETYGYFKIRPIAWHHEVDKVLHQLDTEKFDAQTLLLGDSVGRQVLKQYSTHPDFAYFATNQAIEMTGQLFITERYLERNPPPKSVIFVGLPTFLYMDLQQIYTENFVLRTFTEFDEIISIFKEKSNPSMFLKMLTYKFSTMYKYRLLLQKELLGFSNAEIYTGVDQLRRNEQTSVNHSLLNLSPHKELEQKASYLHFVSLLELLEKNGINFYYIPVPLKKAETVKPGGMSHLQKKLLDEILPTFKKSFSIFSFLPDTAIYENELFVDHVHFNTKGLPLAEKYIGEKVNMITSSQDSEEKKE